MTKQTMLKQPSTMVPVTRSMLLDLRRSLHISKKDMEPSEFQSRHAELVRLEYQRLVNQGMLGCCTESYVMEMALDFANQSPL